MDVRADFSILSWVLFGSLTELWSGLCNFNKYYSAIQKLKKQNREEKFKIVSSARAAVSQFIFKFSRLDMPRTQGPCLSIYEAVLSCLPFQIKIQKPVWLLPSAYTVWNSCGGLIGTQLNNAKFKETTNSPQNRRHFLYTRLFWWTHSVNKSCPLNQWPKHTIRRTWMQN